MCALAPLSPTTPPTTAHHSPPQPTTAHHHPPPPASPHLPAPTRSVLEQVIGLLRSNFESELGAYSKRPSSELYESWVTQAGGIVKGAVRPQPAATLSAEDEEKIVVPLFLLKQSNEEQEPNPSPNPNPKPNLQPQPQPHILNPNPNPNPNPNQMDRLHALLYKSPATIHCMPLRFSSAPTRDPVH